MPFFPALFETACRLEISVSHELLATKGRLGARRLLTRHRVTANQEHVALVADTHRLHRVRQGCGIVAAGVTENVAAIATVVLQQKQQMVCDKCPIR